MKTVISSKGQIAIPANFRNQGSIETGQAFDIECVNKGKYRLVYADHMKNEGLIETLFACPAKGWFVPIESEPTDRVEGPS